MLHIAAGVFLGLIAYTIAIGWWAGRHERRLDRQIRRELRRAKRDRERLEQETARKMQEAAQRAARPPAQPIDWNGTFKAGVAMLAFPAVFAAILALATWWHWQQIH